MPACVRCHNEIPDAALACAYCQVVQRPRGKAFRFLPGRLTGSIVLLVALVALPLWVYRTTHDTRPALAGNPVDCTAMIAVSHPVVSFGMDRGTTSVIVTGTLTNHGPLTYRRVWLQVIFHDASGQIYDVLERASPVRLRPGEATPFTVADRQDFPKAGYQLPTVRVFAEPSFTGAK